MAVNNTYKTYVIKNEVMALVLILYWYSIGFFSCLALWALQHMLS
jgi:hypothetical protein